MNVPRGLGGRKRERLATVQRPLIAEKLYRDEKKLLSKWSIMPERWEVRSWRVVLAWAEEMLKPGRICGSVDV